MGHWGDLKTDAFGGGRTSPLGKWSEKEETTGRSPATVAQTHVASLTPQACVLSLPQKFCSKQLELYLPQHASEPFHGKRLAAGADE